MKRILKISAYIIGICLVFYLLAPDYLLGALKRLGPRIDDYTFFENRVIQAYKHDPWAFDDDYNKMSIPESIHEEIEDYNPVAFLVIQDEKIRYEEYWDGYNENSLSNSFSAAKSVVALMIGIALDEGKIHSLDQPIGDFIPEYAEGSRKGLTIRQVLTMSSGLNWEEKYTTPFSTTARAYYGSNIADLVTDLEVVEKPGVYFDYLSGNTQILAMVVESATGMRISQYASEKLWKPLGASQNALWCLDKDDGMEKAYCCFNTNARDFARYGQLVLNNGIWDNEVVVSEEYISDATSSKDYLLDKRDNNPVDFYGYQWWILEYNGYKIPYMRGILGQYIFSIREKNAVVVRLGHDRSGEYVGRHPKDVYLYLDAAFEILDQ
jgi:CubicO group peptidase (beta-lactamase class C family)